jgi:hypothetical protein
LYNEWGGVQEGLPPLFLFLPPLLPGEGEEGGEVKIDKESYSILMPNSFRASTRALKGRPITLE